jgi:predicted DNA-binding protein (UPF0251 family)
LPRLLPATKEATVTDQQPSRGSLRRGSVAVREREAWALRLRAGGLTYSEIAGQLQVSDRMAARIVHRALGRVVREPAGELLNLELERLDLVWRGSFPRAAAGSARHAEVCLRVLERRARLLGLDAPTRTVAKVTFTDEEVDKLDQEIEALLAAHHQHPEGDP